MRRVAGKGAAEVEKIEKRNTGEKRGENGREGERRGRRRRKGVFERSPEHDPRCFENDDRRQRDDGAASDTRRKINGAPPLAS